MQSLDSYAYSSKLIRVNPLEKLLFSLITMLTCLLLNKIEVSICVLLAMTILIVFRGGTSVKTFIRLMLLPSIFILLSILAIAFGASETPESFILSIKISKLYIGVTWAGLGLALSLALKALATISCLYFLSLTTPMIQVISSLRSLKLPELILELMTLIYRLIFVFIESAEAIYLAQSSRLGYSSIESSFKSFGSLVSALFISAYRRSEELYIALEARGYDGELRVLEEPQQVSLKSYIMIVTFNTLLIALSILTEGLR